MNDRVRTRRDWGGGASARGDGSGELESESDEARFSIATAVNGVKELMHTEFRRLCDRGDGLICGVQGNETKSLEGGSADSSEMNCENPSAAPGTLDFIPFRAEDGKSV